MNLRGHLSAVVLAFGLLCAAQAQGMTVLLVVVNTASLTTEETAIKTQIQSWGYTVTTVAQGDTQTNINTAIAAADVVYVPYTIQEWVLTSELRTSSKGVVVSENQEDAYMGFSTSPGWTFNTTQINITDNSHYITSPFSTGLLTIFNSSLTVNLMNTT